MKFNSDDEMRELARQEHDDILHDGLDEPDFDEGVSGFWRGFQRVGHGVVTNSAETGKRACGGYFGIDFCKYPELHNFVSLDGVSHVGKTFWVKRFRSCDKPSCPICSKRWAQRQARHGEDRILALERALGMKAEHIVWSLSPKFYHLSFEDMRSMMRRDLKACGVVGGYEIFHMERFANWYEAQVKGVPHGWYFSPHFHIVGFIDGGYRCRGCKKGFDKCITCSGFDGRARRVHFGYVDNAGRKHDGNCSIISVKAERMSIWGTFYYQLNHSTIRVDGKRKNVGVWFGVAGKRKLKLKNEDRFVYKCPLCDHVLVHGVFVGDGYVDGGNMELKAGECDYRDSRGVPQFVEVNGYG